MLQPHNNNPKTVPCRLRLNSLPALALLITFIGQYSIAHGKNGGWDLAPYHIQINIAIDAPGGLAERLATDLPRYVQRRIGSSLAPAWTSDIHIATGQDRAKIFTTIAAT